MAGQAPSQERDQDGAQTRTENEHLYQSVRKSVRMGECNKYFIPQLDKYEKMLKRQPGYDRTFNIFMERPMPPVTELVSGLDENTIRCHMNLYARVNGKRRVYTWLVSIYQLHDPEKSVVQAVPFNDDAQLLTEKAEVEKNSKLYVGASRVESMGWADARRLVENGIVTDSGIKGLQLGVWVPESPSEHCGDRTAYAFSHWVWDTRRPKDGRFKIFYCCDKEKGVYAADMVTAGLTSVKPSFVRH